MRINIVIMIIDIYSHFSWTGDKFSFLAYESRGAAIRMRLEQTMKHAPLGIPLTLASVGTVVSLLAGKKLHAGFGIAWTLLSLWHGLQHQKKMKRDAGKLTELSICRPAFHKRETASPWERLLDSLQILSFIEGRVRLRSPWFVNNERLKKQMEEYIASFTGITKAEINILTGSLLIEYQPEQLRAKPRLAALEHYLANKISNRE